MESDISQAFQEELTCLICLSYLTDPVTISCGHSFCRACLLHLSGEDMELPVHCPMCREPCHQKDFRTNVTLKKLVSIVKGAGLMKSLSSLEHKCITHQDSKRIFCVESRVLICQLCSDSQEHRGHRHCPTEAAAEGQMERILKEMTSLWEKILKNQENLEGTNRMISHWKSYVSLREEIIKTEYQKLHPIHSEEKQRHIECIKSEGQTILVKLKESEAMMVQRRNQLREVYQELMTMSQEPYVVLLQDLNDMFKRSDFLQPCMPLAMKPELSAQPIIGLTEKFSCFRVHVAFEDAIALHYRRSLFNDIRLSFRHHHLQTPADSQGYCFASWGSRTFISGKYYWEVDLKDSWNWAVGVCKQSWLLGRNQRIESGVFLLVCVKEGSHYSLLTTCPVLHHYIEKPLGRVGILLDCDHGCVSFLNVARSSLIYRFPPGRFNYRVMPFFSSGNAPSQKAILEYFHNM